MSTVASYATAEMKLNHLNETQSSHWQNTEQLTVLSVVMLPSLLTSHIFLEDLSYAEEM